MRAASLYIVDWRRHDYLGGVIGSAIGLLPQWWCWGR
jgi:hypothetical protein